MPDSIELVDETEFNETLEEITNQLTQHKLDYVRQFLKEREVRGISRLNRLDLREQLESSIRSGVVTEDDLQVLLDELDHWGNQRILLCKFPVATLVPLRNPETLNARLAEIKLDHLLDGKISLKPTPELTPMRVSLFRDNDASILKISAAKTRDVWLPRKDIPNIEQADYPGIVFKPFKLEVQKAVAYAEINLTTGFAFVSARIFRQGQGYKAEFSEFFELFDGLLPFEQRIPIELYTATMAIYGLPVNEVRLLGQNRKTQTGNSIGYRSQSKRFDFRADNEMNQNWRSLPNARNNFCNCVWASRNGLTEEVHSHVYAPEGQVTILGEAREGSVKYVLHRIIGLN